MGFEGDATVWFEGDVFGFEAFALAALVVGVEAGTDAAGGVDDAVPGEGIEVGVVEDGFGEGGEGVADVSGVVGQAGEAGDLAIGRDPTAGDAADHGVEGFVVLHGGWGSGVGKSQSTIIRSGPSLCSGPA